jgi:hypothetical protein
MADTTHRAYQSAAASALTTQLNTLANNTSSSASSSIDNSSTLELFADIELYIAAQSVARSAGATVQVYMNTSLDGTNFTTLSDTTAELVAVFPMDAATTARRAIVRDVPIPPGLFQFFVRNATGQSFAASGNLLNYRLHSIKSV